MAVQRTHALIVQILSAIAFTGLVRSVAIPRFQLNILAYLASAAPLIPTILSAGRLQVDAPKGNALKRERPLASRNTQVDFQVLTRTLALHARQKLLVSTRKQHAKHLPGALCQPGVRVRLLAHASLESKRQAAPVGELPLRLLVHLVVQLPVATPWALLRHAARRYMVGHSLLGGR